MQVFISWSGARSKALAATLRDWLPRVIQALEPWFSPEDIDKGARWLLDLNSQLQAQSVAIICVTYENRSAPWLLFEAGALSKSIDSSCISPLLLGLESTDLEGPLAQFQATQTTKQDVRQLLATFNQRLPRPIDERYLDATFELFWPQLEQTIHELLASEPAEKPKPRSEKSLLNEVLVKLRTIERFVVRATEQPATLPPDTRRKRDSRDPAAALLARAQRILVSLGEARSGLKAVNITLSSLPAEATDERTRLLDQKERLERRIEYFESDLAEGAPPHHRPEPPAAL